jgi:tRNA U38,U39,U40 pseudouridine synthase TruA
MPRYKLTIEYDGTPFCGWQLQDNLPSVQGALEAAVKAMSGEDVRVHGMRLRRSRIAILPSPSPRAACATG